MNNTAQRFGGQRKGQRSWLSAMRRGAAKRCPACGTGKLFRAYTTICEDCNVCGLHLAGHQADDAPPYVTIMIVGHIMIPLALAVKQLFDPPLTLQFAIWAPLIIAATVWLLPISKGAMVGLQWANRMHGFAGPGDLPSAGACEKV